MIDHEATKGPMLACVDQLCGWAGRLCQTKDVKGKPVCPWCQQPVRSIPKTKPLKGGK